MKKLFVLLSVTIALFLSAEPVSAHEVYVLSRQEFSQGMRGPMLNTLKALTKPQDIQLTILLVIVVLAVLICLFFFRYSRLGLEVDRRLKSIGVIGLFVIRVALGAAFIYAASTNSIFGPELSLSSLPVHQLLPLVEYFIGALFLVGLGTELAAAVALALYVLVALHYGAYALTYLNYLGEILALLFFGSRFLSLDLLFFGQRKRLSKLKVYENTIIRVFYGLALLFATVNIKIIHAQISLEVVNKYRLNTFHLLFPPDPLLIVLGAAIVETVISLFILVGFSTRLVNAIMVFYLTLSIIFFKEAVWPHYMLYGISLSLLLNGGGKLSLDDGIGRSIMKKRRRLVSVTRQKLGRRSSA